MKQSANQRQMSRFFKVVLPFCEILCETFL